MSTKKSLFLQFAARLEVCCESRAVRALVPAATRQTSPGVQIQPLFSVEFAPVVRRLQAVHVLLAHVRRQSCHVPPTLPAGSAREGLLRLEQRLGIERQRRQRCERHAALGFFIYGSGPLFFFGSFYIVCSYWASRSLPRYWRRLKSIFFVIDFFCQQFFVFD